MSKQGEPPDFSRMKLDEIAENGDRLSEVNLKWSIRLDEALKAQGFLTERQVEVLDNIHAEVTR